MSQCGKRARCVCLRNERDADERGVARECEHDVAHGGGAQGPGDRCFLVPRAQAIEGHPCERVSEYLGDLDGREERARRSLAPPEAALARGREVHRRQWAECLCGSQFTDSQVHSSSNAPEERATHAHNPTLSTPEHLHIGEKKACDVERQRAYMLERQ